MTVIWHKAARSLLVDMLHPHGSYDENFYHGALQTGQVFMVSMVGLTIMTIC
jgi:hypothetical protein